MGQEKPFELNILKVASILSPDINYLVVDNVAARDLIISDKRRKGITVTWGDGLNVITKKFVSDDITNLSWQTESNWVLMGKSFPHTVVSMTPDGDEFYVDITHGLKTEIVSVSATKNGNIGITYSIIDIDSIRVVANQDISPFNILINT